jgi:hypothetical protein
VQIQPSAHLTLDDLRREPTIYLVPKSDHEDEALEFLDQNAAGISKSTWMDGIEYLRLGRQRATWRHSGAGLNLAFIPCLWIFAMIRSNTKKCRGD